MTLNLDLEIKTLLEKSNDPEVVAQELIQSFLQSPEDWSESQVRELCRFLLNAGLYRSLIEFCVNRLSSNENFKAPWDFFIQALSLSRTALPDTVAHFITMGIQDQEAADLVCLAEGAEQFVINAKELKAAKMLERRRESSRLKKQLLDEIDVLRSQQLFEQEKLTLAKLQRLFPGDAQIAEQMRSHKERNAMDVLARKSPGKFGIIARMPEVSEETQVQVDFFKTSIIKAAKENPELAYEFAVAAMMIDSPELSLEILEGAELAPEQRWFLIDIKLKCRRFLEVLSDLNELELVLAHEPETFFASAYLRAQAYWGLQQKHLAIEVLENILAARPHYRSAAALLDLWRLQ